MEELDLVVLLRVQAAALLAEKPRADESGQRGQALACSVRQARKPQMHSLLKLQRCTFSRSCCGFGAGSGDYFLCMCLSTLFGFGINKQTIPVCLLLSFCNLSLRIGKLPESCVQN